MGSRKGPVEGPKKPRGRPRKEVITGRAPIEKKVKAKNKSAPKPAGRSSTRLKNAPKRYAGGAPEPDTMDVDGAAEQAGGGGGDNDGRVKGKGKGKGSGNGTGRGKAASKARDAVRKDDDDEYEEGHEDEEDDDAESEEETEDERPVGVRIRPKPRLSKCRVPAHLQEDNGIADEDGVDVMDTATAVQNLLGLEGTSRFQYRCAITRLTLLCITDRTNVGAAKKGRRKTAEKVIEVDDDSEDSDEEIEGVSRHSRSSANLQSFLQKFTSSRFHRRTARWTASVFPTIPLSNASNSRSPRVWTFRSRNSISDTRSRHGR